MNFVLPKRVLSPTPQRPDFRSLLSHRLQAEFLKPLQIRHTDAGAGSFSARRYPIGLQDGQQALLQPDDRANQRDEARVAAVRAVLELQVAQHEVREERGPDLPLDRVLVLAVEVLELERLLELPEQQLDLPPRAVELRDSAALHDAVSLNLARRSGGQESAPPPPYAAHPSLTPRRAP